MLALDDARWGLLRQAFGTAEDVPRVIAALGEVPDAARAELWYALWRMLCPDGSADTASLAAVPHLVAFAAPRPAAAGAPALHLAAAVEVARLAGRAPEPPADLADGYRAALARMAAVVAAQASAPWDADTAQVLAAALLAAKGHGGLAGALLALEPVTSCPACGTRFPTAGWEGAGDAP